LENEKIALWELTYTYTDFKRGTYSVGLLRDTSAVISTSILALRNRNTAKF